MVMSFCLSGIFTSNSKKNKKENDGQFIMCDGHTKNRALENEHTITQLG